MFRENGNGMTRTYPGNAMHFEKRIKIILSTQRQIDKNSMFGWETRCYVRGDETQP